MKATGEVPLSAEDSAILAKESPTVVGHVCKVILVGGRLDVGALRASIRQRITSTPALTRRLGGAPDAPAWVEDTSFRIDDHVVDTTGAEPLGTSELQRRIGLLFTQHLERRRPLWRIDVLGPLEDGGSAIVWRLHHALADGRTAMLLAAALLWDLESPPPTGAASLAVAGAQAEQDHRRHRHNLVAFAEREFRRDHTPSPFDGRIGADRSISFASASLGQLRKAAKAVCGATVNDAVLACVTGGLRKWLELDHGPPRSIRVKVPVSLHQAGDHLANHDSFFCLNLPVGEPSHAERLRIIHLETTVRKRDHDAQQLDRLLSVLGRGSPRVRRAVERFLSDPRGFAVNVSNVRGPDAPVSVLGLPVRRLFALADVAERHALRVATISMADQLSFGLCADSALIEDLPALAGAVQTEADTLASMA